MLPICCFERTAISLLEQTLERLNEGTNISAASWFAQEIVKLNVEESASYLKYSSLAFISITLLSSMGAKSWVTQFYSNPALFC